MGKSIKIFESSNGHFGLNGNRTGNPVVTGWKESRIGDKKKASIYAALSDSNTQSVYKRGKKIYALLLNGLENELKVN